jgi:hypothetical protein
MNQHIVNIVDAPCGYGKTSWAIQAMNETHPDTHKFIYVTPFLNEVQRVKNSVKNREFYEPSLSKNGETKLEDLHRLLKEKKDICTTHALFQSANAETRRLLKDSSYTLILDEVLNVIEQVDLKKHDLDVLQRAGVVTVTENNMGIKYIQWNEKKEYDTKYNKERNMALTGNLLYCRDSILIWNFPCEMFKLFNHVYILTYLFSGQQQRYYYDLHNIQYRYLSVQEAPNGVNLIPYDERLKHDKNQLKELINIYEGRLNEIGDRRTALSSTWLKDNNNTKTLRNNAYNYLTNIIMGKSKNTLWTTIKHCFDKVQPRNFKQAFIPVSTRATNEYKDRYNLAYLVNRFMNPIEKSFFNEHGVEVNEDTWALSELIQWVWRSRIREEKPINIYLPSSRMRSLLIRYLTSDYFENPPEGSITNQYSSDWNM